MKITPEGVQSVFDSGGYLSWPFGLAFDGLGNLYVGTANIGSNSIVKISSLGVQTLLITGGNIDLPNFIAFGPTPTATVEDPNYQGKATGTLTISLYKAYLPNVLK